MLIAAAQHGFLADIKERGGLVAFTTGTGAEDFFRRLTSHSNSLGSVFTECLVGLRAAYAGDDKAIMVLDALERKASYSDLLEVGKEYCLLATIGAFLEDLHKAVWEAAAADGTGLVELNRGHRVVSVQLNRGGGLHTVTVENEATGAHRSVTGRNVLLCLGGYQSRQTMMNVNLGHEGHSVPLGPFSAKVRLAHDVLQSAELPLPHYTAEKPLVIAGGSHSALAVAWSLLNVSKTTFDPGSIVLLSRSPICLFYATAEEATADGYEFDPVVDVCPFTKRVNRYGGLRGPAFELARSAFIAGTETRLVRLQMMRAEGSMAEARALLENASCIVAAVGFSARLPGKITDETDQPLLLHQDSLGALSVSPTGMCMGVGGDGVPFPLKGVFAFGLGAGLRSDKDASGGEPSFSGRVDGVWLYQNDMGTQVLRDMLRSEGTRASPGPATRAARWHAIYDKKGIVADQETPLHVIGGYHMFTLQQWDAQIALLAAPFAESLRSGAAVLEIGVGGGAVLDSLTRICATGATFKLSGMDYSASVVEMARARLVGEFKVGNAVDIVAAGYAKDTYDLVLSFGVMQYLNNLDDARAKVRGMMAVAKPDGGIVYFCEVSDLAKKDLADELRGVTHTRGTADNVSSDAPDHLYVPKSLFEEAAAEMGCSVEFKDHDDLGLTYATAPYRFSCYCVRAAASTH